MVATASKSWRQNLTVCLVDSDPNSLSLAKNHLQQGGFPVITALSSDEGVQKIREGECRVVIAEIGTSATNGFQLLDAALQSDPALRVIFTSNARSESLAIDAIRRGAYDCLCKPLDFSRLCMLLDEMAEALALRAEARELEERISETQSLPGMVGKSRAILEVFDLAKRLARHKTDILITGPSGAGKERIARAMHGLYAAPADPFTVCDCPAVADALLESQLRVIPRPSGAGANHSWQQTVEITAGGTLFVEEIGETSLSTQARLLAAIRRRDVARSDLSVPEQGTLRIIAASSRSLAAQVLAGSFREDLFQRLSGVEIRVPGLAERPEDIPTLVLHFVNKYNQANGTRLQGVTRRAETALLQHDWPENVREIEDAISSAAAVTQNDWIDLDCLPEYLRVAHGKAASAAEEWRPAPLEEMRRIHIQRMLTMCKGNRVRAARVLGIGRTSLYRFLKRSARQSAASHVVGD